MLTTVLVPITNAIVMGLIADLDAPAAGLIRLDTTPLDRLRTDLNAR